VNLLIDSHALFWWLTDNPRLSTAAEAAISDRANTAFVSACVGYELYYKRRLGRIPPLPGDIVRRLQDDGFQILPILLIHAKTAADLPGPHRDPWDRIMMAQALTEGLQVVTLDKVFSDYGVPVLW
jgi:PIN domain nuclease of toxin-antitoxin system